MQQEQDKPTRSESDAGTVRRAVWRGHVIAESDRTRAVGGYVYFPRESVLAGLLRATPKTARDLECPHGVQFYDLVQGQARSERAAWSYEAPRGEMRSIDRWIGFWEDVEVGPAPRAGRGSEE